VNREATYIDLAHGAAVAPGALQAQVRERARLASLSRRHRRAFEARATGLVEDLVTSVPVEPHDEARLRQAVADAAMGIAGGVTVIVLSGLPTQDESVGRTWADSLAVELVSRGMTVILLQGEPSRRQPASPAGPELRAEDTGKSKVEVE